MMGDSVAYYGRTLKEAWENFERDTMISEKEMEEILERMETYGGSFVKQLALLYRLADPINKRKLLNCFREYFEQYRQ